MSSKLAKLIAHYEAEDAALTAQIDECVSEMAYGMAKRLTKGLFLVREQLQTLRSLQDKFFDDKRQMAHLRELLEEDDRNKWSDYRRRYLLDSIDALNQKIEALENAQKSAPKNPLPLVLQDVLRKLLAGEITQFYFVIDKEQNLNCVVKLVCKTLIMTIPEIRRHLSEDLFQKRQIRQIISFGFRLYDHKDKLMLFLPCSCQEEISGVKTVLAQLVFEVFYFKDLEGKTYVRYFEGGE